MTDRSGARYLTLDDLLQIARYERLQAVADLGLLASAAARPQASAFGEDAYPSLWEKASALMESVARNHALVDGNKRLAWLATIVFLRLNGERIVMSDDDAVGLVLEVVAGTKDVRTTAAALRDAEQAAS